jgi:hypothetical protein
MCRGIASRVVIFDIDIREALYEGLWRSGLFIARRSRVRR